PGPRRPGRAPTTGGCQADARQPTPAQQSVQRITALSRVYRALSGLQTSPSTRRPLRSLFPDSLLRVAVVLGISGSDGSIRRDQLVGVAGVSRVLAAVVEEAGYRVNAQHAAGDIQLADELAHRREQHLASAWGRADDEEIVATAGDKVNHVAQRLAVDVNDLQADDVVQVELVIGEGHTLGFGNPEGQAAQLLGGGRVIYAVELEEDDAL